MSLTINELKIFCETMSHRAGTVLLDYKNNYKVVKQKDIQDIATSADIASEKYIIKTILDRYPDHGIISEERGEINPESKYKWIIDPLDGTKEYVRNIPQWNCSIALQYLHETIVASVYRPHENVLFSAGKNLGSFRNRTKINVSKVKDLGNSFIYCYLPSYTRNKNSYEWSFDKLKLIGKKSYRLRSYADENTALCWLAQGGCEAYLNLSNPPKDYDIIPGLFIAKEAGAFNVKNENPLIVSNNKNIYNDLINILNI